MSAASPHQSISILLLLFNAGLYLQEQIESILNQSWSDFELLTVNDGSVDDSLHLPERYANDDKRFRYRPDRSATGSSRTLKRKILLLPEPLSASIRDSSLAFPYLVTLSESERNPHSPARGNGNLERRELLPSKAFVP